MAKRWASELSCVTMPATIVSASFSFKSPTFRWGLPCQEI